MRSTDPAVVLTDDQHRAADAGHKAMMPIAGRPFLDFVLSAAADAGLTRVAIVVAPDHNDLRHHYETVAPPGRVRVDFVVQTEPRGTADAVLAAERWIGDDSFLVMNGDNLYPVPDVSALRDLGEPGLLGFDPEDPRNPATCRPTACARLPDRAGRRGAPDADRGKAIPGRHETARPAGA